MKTEHFANCTTKLLKQTVFANGGMRPDKPFSKPSLESKKKGRCEESTTNITSLMSMLKQTDDGWKSPEADY